MRGAVVVRNLELALDGIIPAHAGSRPRRKRCRTASWDHPRACGEQSFEHLCSASRTGSSPRMRGAVACSDRPHVGYGIIPAHAGSRVGGVWRASGDGDHPRACGEQTDTEYCGGPPMGSSPRMRGADVHAVHALIHHGIIPAHAGSSVCEGHADCGHGDHPRACGEQRAVEYSHVNLPGSSPRMRGAVGRPVFKQ